MALAYRCCLIWRSYLIKSLSGSSLSRRRNACILTTRTIVDLCHEEIPKLFYQLWNVTSWLVAATLILDLDMVTAANNRQVPSDAAERRFKLYSLNDLLRAHADRSGIGVRGARFVSNLRGTEGDIITGRQISLASITHKEIMTLVSHESADSRAHGGLAW